MEVDHALPRRRAHVVQAAEEILENLGARGRHQARWVDELHFDGREGWPSVMTER
jgi:hypothetical protein